MDAETSQFQWFFLYLHNYILHTYTYTVNRFIHTQKKAPLQGFTGHMRNNPPTTNSIRTITSLNVLLCFRSSSNSSSCDSPSYLLSFSNICFPFFNTSIVTIVTIVTLKHLFDAMQFLTIGTPFKV